MKNKIIAVLAAAVIGVTSFATPMTTQAFNYEMPCYKCGQDSLLSEVIRYEYVTISHDPVACTHGHCLEADYLCERRVLVRYYCSDCDIRWENWEYAGQYRYCTYDHNYYYDD